MFCKYPLIENEIKKCSADTCKFYIFAYKSVLTAIDKILLCDLNLEVNDKNPYRKYLYGEFDKCEKYQKQYPIETGKDISSERELYEIIENYLIELSEVFFDSFPYKELFKNEMLGNVFGFKCENPEDYFFAYTNASFNLLCTLELNLYPELEDEFDDGKDDELEYERASDDTLYVDDDNEDIIKFHQGIDKHVYMIKSYESICERDFYKKILRVLSRNYHLIAQVCLASIMDKAKLDGSSADHRGELFRIIDFGIFDDDYKIKLLIEVNDKTHDSPRTQIRDKKVQAILDRAGIKLIKFKPQDRFNIKFLISQLSEFVKPELLKD